VIVAHFLALLAPLFLPFDPFLALDFLALLLGAAAF